MASSLRRADGLYHHKCEQRLAVLAIFCVVPQCALFIVEQFVDEHVLACRMVWRTVTSDMASSMRECLQRGTFQKSFDILCAVAEGVVGLADPRLRLDPPVPQSAMTHVCLRCPGNPARGDPPQALLVAAEQLRAQHGIILFGGLQSKFHYGGGAYGSSTGPPKGSVQIGKEGLADDEYVTRPMR